MVTPPEFLCPISMEVMEDPVLCEDGKTYERRHIVEWLKVSPTSPLTRQPMTIQMIRPNLSLKASIQRWKKQAKLSAMPAAIPVPPPSAPVPYQLTSYQAQAQAQQQIPSYTVPQTAAIQWGYSYLPPPPPLQNISQQQYTRPQQQQEPRPQPQDIRRASRFIMFACVGLLILILISIIMTHSSKARSSSNDDDN